MDLCPYIYNRTSEELNKLSERKHKIYGNESS